MASSFTHSPGYEAGGSSVYTWLDYNWKPADWALELDPLSAVSATEDCNTIVFDEGKFPVAESAIAFRNFRPLKDGRDGGYMAEPVAIAGYALGMEHAINKPVYARPVWGVKGGDVIIPLGQPRWSKETTKTVLRQSARMWCSGGANTAGMSDENVLVMYYGALQSLAYAASIAEDKAKQAWLFGALVHLTRSFALVIKEEPLFQKITTAMVMTPGVDDMLQKTLAHVFHPHAVWGKETRLDMLAIVLRRNMRRGAKLVGMAPCFPALLENKVLAPLGVAPNWSAPGPFAVFVLAPLLRGIAMNPQEPVAPTALLARYNTGMQKLLDAFVARASSDPIFMEVMALVALTEAIGAPLTEYQARELLCYLKTETRISAQLPWVVWGAIPPPPELVPKVTTGSYPVAGKPHATFDAIIRPSSPTAFRVLGFKGVTWSAVEFDTPGRYTVVAHDLGVAQQGEGDTRGKELVANWRITSGYDILPKAVPGYSSAGMEHVNTVTYGGHCPKVTWNYVRKTPIPFGTPFTIVVTHGRDIVLEVGGKRIFWMHMSMGPALLAFKNLWLDVNYAPLPTVVKPEPPKVDLATAAERGPVNYAAAARGELKRADLDLPPAALISKLREAAMTV